MFNPAQIKLANETGNCLFFDCEPGDSIMIIQGSVSSISHGHTPEIGSVIATTTFNRACDVVARNYKRVMMVVNRLADDQFQVRVVH